MAYLQAVRNAGENLAALSGLEALHAMIAGRLPAPSMARTLGFTLAEAGEGWATFVGYPSADVLNPMGGVHGGWALTLIDSAAGCAAHTLLPADAAYTTVETKANFVRAITPATGAVTAEGRVLAAGRTIITAEARVLDARGVLLAHGSSTLLVRGAKNEGNA
ncbi:MAG: PaaI family thioesterase [Hyphomonadaceae bacterium]